MIFEYELKMRVERDFIIVVKNIFIICFQLFKK